MPPGLRPSPWEWGGDPWEGSSRDALCPWSCWTCLCTAAGTCPGRRLVTEARSGRAWWSWSCPGTTSGDSRGCSLVWGCRAHETAHWKRPLLAMWALLQRACGLPERPAGGETQSLSPQRTGLPRDERTHLPQRSGTQPLAPARFLLLCRPAHLPGRRLHLLHSPGLPTDRQTDGEGAYLPPPWTRAAPRRPPGRRGRGPRPPGHGPAPAGACTPPAAAASPLGTAVSPRWPGSGSGAAPWFCSGQSHPAGPQAGGQSPRQSASEGRAEPRAAQPPPRSHCRVPKKPTQPTCGTSETLNTGAPVAESRYHSYSDRDGWPLVGRRFQTPSASVLLTLGSRQLLTQQTSCLLSLRLKPKTCFIRFFF